MSWVTDEGKHEGYVTKLLPNGQCRAARPGARAADDTVVPHELVWVDDDPAAERPVPSSDVLGWQGRCDGCGCIGKRYERVTDTGLADVAAGRVYSAEGSDPPADLEDVIHAEWRRHLIPHKAIAAVAEAAREADVAQSRLAAAVAAARTAGVSWEKIGSAAGITRQTAHERWARATRR